MDGEIPASLKKSAEMYAGCVSGAIQKNDYVDIINKTGFKNVEIVQSKTIIIPSILPKRISVNGIPILMLSMRKSSLLT